MREDVIMGWDAAWTPNGTGAWAVARGREVMVWEATPQGSGLLDRLGEILAEWRPKLVAMDFPLEKGGVCGWRVADLETTRTFSRYGCPVHSPTDTRPGEWGIEIMEVLTRHGYEIGVETPLPEVAVVEVYPHTVLLEMYRSDFRIPYKAGRSAVYWPGLDLKDRKDKILRIHEGIHARLQKQWNTDALPGVPENPTLSDLKSQEDLLDALLCLRAAEGVQTGSFLPYGDEHAAIWNPGNPR